MDGVLGARKGRYYVFTYYSTETPEMFYGEDEL